MTTPVKVYQNVSYNELISFSKNNPNRSRTLDAIEIHTDGADYEVGLDKLLLPTYTAYAMEPEGVLSVMSYIQDPMHYSLVAKNGRLQLLMDLCTQYQENTTALKNTVLSRKRKKIYDLIATAYSGGALQDKDYADLFQGLSFMSNNHFILINEAVPSELNDSKGAITFSSDPSTWSKDNPVWIADSKARWVATPIGITNTIILSDWLEQLERAGWIIKWPEVDGTKTELLEKLTQITGPQDTDKKLVRDVLSVRLGRILALRVLSTLRLDYEV
jgi:hypothetical protein